MGAFCGLTAPVPARFTDPAGDGFLVGGCANPTGWIMAIAAAPTPGWQTVPPG